MKKIILFLILSYTVFSNAYELKLKELEISKKIVDQYVKQKNINYSEMEKLKLDEVVVKKQFELVKFIQKKLEEKEKYIVQIEELKQLISILNIKKEETNNRYLLLAENPDGISKLELQKMKSNIDITLNEIEKNTIKLSYLQNLVISNQYSYINKELKTRKMREEIINYYNSMREIKEQEFKLSKVSRQGISQLTLKQLELEGVIEEKEIEVENYDSEIKKTENEYKLLIIDKKNLDLEIEQINKEEKMVEEEVILGAKSQQEAFEILLKKHDLLEKKIKIEGEISLKEIELNQ